ncbi:hypothetical protein GCM10008014_04460 [Paenibacillus silvae]|uniref:Uncharacterized protein n=1 Tax=Paenibacillus silvae TaxID=1325358 RepID=A0ABQ1YYK0_9BACL|nr:hypothetical protein GCM10008014_04460 [Paenibacillus silvae]
MSLDRIKNTIRDNYLGDIFLTGSIDSENSRHVLKVISVRIILKSFILATIFNLDYIIDSILKLK